MCGVRCKWEVQFVQCKTAGGTVCILYPPPVVFAAGRIFSWQACLAQRSGLLMEAFGNMDRHKTRFPDVGPERRD